MDSGCYLSGTPVFDSVLGFGGNGPYTEEGFVSDPFDIPGRTGGGCVPDGPFANQTLNIGPGYSVTSNSSCLKRDISPEIVLRTLNSSVVAHTLAQPNFESFDIAVQGGTTIDTFTIHAGGHLGIGGKFGTMADVYSSPNGASAHSQLTLVRSKIFTYDTYLADPLFYLHHANLDRIWAKWQSADSSRLTDISGPVTQFGYPFGNATNTQNVTLAFPLSLGDIAPNVTVGDVMSTQGNTLCYTYV